MEANNESTWFNKSFYWLLAGFAAADVVSLAVYQWPPIGSCLAILLAFMAAVLVWRQPEFAWPILLAELIAGGKGYLLFVPIHNFHLSLRLLLFLVIALVLYFKILQQKKWSVLFNKLVLAWLPFAALWCWAVILGFVYQRSASGIFLDANAYLYLALLPALLSTPFSWQKISRVLLAATVWLGFWTFLVLFLFGHDYASVSSNIFYQWLRHAGLGEITEINAPLFRIFFYSHLWNLFAALALAYYWLSQKVTRPGLVGGLLFLNIATVVISQSRSFWVAGVTAFVALLIFAISHASYRQRVWSLILIVVLSLLVSPWLVKLLIGDFSKNLFFERLSENAVSTAATSSRKAQILPLLKEINQAPWWGHGFHQTITYQSSDPRIKNAANPQGWLTTDTFELAYLDMLLKFGIIGLACFMAALLYLLSVLTKNYATNHWFTQALPWLLLALLVTQAFTPYLNHPLGIGLILTATLVANKLKPQEK